MVDIVGISAGRQGKVTESLVRAILEATGSEYEFYTLSGTLIRPCEACLGCVETNRCVLKDDFTHVMDAMICRDSCPENAFQKGEYDRPACIEHLNTDQENALPSGNMDSKGKPILVTRWCRSCELACPVGK